MTSLGWIPVDWDLRCLSELGSFSKGKGITKEELSDSGLPCVRYGEIYTTHDYQIKEFKSFIKDDIAKLSKRIYQGDVLFAGSGETREDIGKAVAFLGDEEAYAGGDVIVFSPIQKIIDSRSFSFMLDSAPVRKQRGKLGEGNQVVHIYPSDLGTIKVPLPPLSEQKAIAKVLSTWDKAIEKTQELIKQKELRKKYLMQQLLTGKKRLKGFSGEWKEYKLGELGKFSKGKGILKEQVKQYGHPCIRYGEIYTTRNNVLKELKSFIDDSISKESVAIKRNDVLIAGSGETIEEIGKAVVYVGNEQAFAGGDVIIFSAFELLDSIFLVFILETASIQRQKRELGQGHSVVHIYPSDMSNIILRIPSIYEQKEIVEVLRFADNEISYLNEKIEALQKQKKGLMQVLLTGKKRLKSENYI